MEAPMEAKGYNNRQHINSIMNIIPYQEIIHNHVYT